MWFNFDEKLIVLSEVPTVAANANESVTSTLMNVLISKLNVDRESL